jgi:hypothetical protein
MLFSVEWERGLLTKRLLNFLATLDFSTFSLSYIHIHPISVVSFCHPDSTCASDETSLTLSEQPGAKPNSPFLKKAALSLVSSRKLVLQTLFGARVQE